MLSNWHRLRNDGSIPESLLPASQWQYRIEFWFEVPISRDSFITTVEYEVIFWIETPDAKEPKDSPFAQKVIFRFHVSAGNMGGVVFYSYWTGDDSITIINRPVELGFSQGEQDEEMKLYPYIGDPDGYFELGGGSDYGMGGGGIPVGYIFDAWYSPVWEVPLPLGSKFRIFRHTLRHGYVNRVAVYSVRTEKSPEEQALAHSALIADAVNKLHWFVTVHGEVIGRELKSDVAAVALRRVRLEDNTEIGSDLTQMGWEVAAASEGRSLFDGATVADGTLVMATRDSEDEKLHLECWRYVGGNQPYMRTEDLEYELLDGIKLAFDVVDRSLPFFLPGKQLDDEWIWWCVPVNCRAGTIRFPLQVSFSSELDNRKLTLRDLTITMVSTRMYLPQEVELPEKEAIITFEEATQDLMAHMDTSRLRPAQLVLGYWDGKEFHTLPAGYVIPSNVGVITQATVTMHQLVVVGTAGSLGGIPAGPWESIPARTLCDFGLNYVWGEVFEEDGDIIVRLGRGRTVESATITVSGSEVSGEIQLLTEQIKFGPVRITGDGWLVYIMEEGAFIVPSLDRVVDRAHFIVGKVEDKEVDTGIQGICVYTDAKPAGPVKIAVSGAGYLHICWIEADKLCDLLFEFVGGPERIRRRDG